MKNEKLDWLKAVKERPEDAAIQLEHYYVLEGRRTFALDRLAEAARVQSVAEAESALAELVEANYCALSDGVVQLRVHKAVDALKKARAREAAEEESHKKGGSCWGGEQ